MFGYLGAQNIAKNSDEAINTFRETFPEEAQAICNTDKEIEFWWQDESRVGQQVSLTRTWATKGTRPRLVRKNQFISTYIFGAVCPSKDKGCALILPQTNTGTMQLHLEQISLQVDENCHAIIFMDR
ncbi:MAG: transposase, partial [Oligoflexales bacterium]